MDTWRCFRSLPGRRSVPLAGCLLLGLSAAFVAIRSGNTLTVRHTHRPSGAQRSPFATTASACTRPMASAGVHIHQEAVTDPRGRGDVLKATVTVGSAEDGTSCWQLTWREALDLWRARDKAFTYAFLGVLRDNPFPAYFFESPPLTSESEGRPFEFILRDSRELARVTDQPDAGAFSSHLRGGSVNVFPNLGRDAVLVAPAREGSTPEAAYTHLAAFVRGAPEEQVWRLWAEVGDAVSLRLAELPGQRLWLSTSGLGVSWLHVRLDTVPKYYTYTPYREDSGHLESHRH